MCSEAQVCHVVDLIKSSSHFRIISLKNRFKQPFHTGYQDVLIHLIFTYESEVHYPDTLASMSAPMSPSLIPSELPMGGINTKGDAGARRRSARMSLNLLNASALVVGGKRTEQFSFICEFFDLVCSQMMTFRVSFVNL